MIDKDFDKIVELIDDIDDNARIRETRWDGYVALANSEKIITELLKHYQIVDKDKVVLSREEYDRLKRVENEKDRLYEIKLDLENQLIEKGWTDYEGADEIENRVSKKTAEKILKDLKPLLEGFVHKDTGENLYVYKCRQFDVEIKEN